MAKKGASPRFMPASDSASSEMAPGNSYMPDLGPVTREAPPPKMAANAPYFLKAHPERWTVFGDTVIPAFGRLVLQAGVNGVSDLGGRLRAGDARNMAEESGWTIIPVGSIPETHRTPGEEPSYLYQPVGRPDVTLLIYERCYPGSDRVEPDQARYVEFCEYLQSSGIISPPILYALHKLKEKLVHERDSFATKALANASYKASLAIAAKHVEVVEAAIAAREGEQVKPSRRAAAPDMTAEGLG